MRMVQTAGSHENDTVPFPCVPEPRYGCRGGQRAGRSGFAGGGAGNTVFEPSLAVEVSGFDRHTVLAGGAVPLAGRTVFSAQTEWTPGNPVSANSLRIFATDGTTAGTQRIGQSTGLLLRGGLLGLEGQAWFAGVRAGTSGWELRLFRTDGTATGTVEVCSLDVSAHGRYDLKSGPVFSAGRIYVGYVRASGDGAASAVLSIDPATGQTEFFPVPVTSLGGLMADEDDLFFTSYSGSYYTQLHRVARPGGSFAAPVMVEPRLSGMARAGGWIYFSTYDPGVTGAEHTYRRTNGQTTTPLAGAATFPNLGSGAGAFTEDGLLYHAMDGGTQFPDKTGLWVTDGTAAGTRRLMTQRIVSVTPVEGGRLAVLTGDPANPPFDLWAATATEAWLVKSAVPRSFVFPVAGGVALEESGPDINGPWVRNVWTSTLQPRPLHLAGSLTDTASSSVSRSCLTLHNGAGVFYVQAPEIGSEPWIMDSVAGPPRLLKNLSAEMQARASLYGEANGRLIYRSYSVFSTLGNGDRTKVLTDPILDNYEGALDSFKSVTAGGQCFFGGRPPSGFGTAEHLYRTDGTAAGTSALDAPNAWALRAAGNLVYLAATSSLRVTNTGANTNFPTTLNQSCSPVGYTQNGNAVYFTTSDGKVWQARNSGEVHEAGAPGTPAGDVAILPRSSAGAGWEPWRTDGTAAGTFQLVDANPGSTGSEMSDVTKVGAEWWFVTRDNYDQPAKLWSTDGTAAGTQLRTTMPVAAFPLQPISANTNPVLGAGGKIYFRNSAGRLWSSDGTAAGTMEIGQGYGQTVWRNVIFYNGYSTLGGNELWTSDGTAAGTFMVEDLIPGPEGSNPEGLTVAGDRLYYRTSVPMGDTGLTIPQIRKVSAVPAPATFAAWAAAAGLSGADAQPLANPSGDGVVNLLKYAFNLNPAAPDRRGLPPDGTGDAGLPRIDSVKVRDLVDAVEITWLKRSGAGLVYTVESSAGLQTWETVPGVSRDVTAAAAGWERCTMSVARGRTGMFLRVSVALAE